MNALIYKKDNEEVLKDNLQMIFEGFGSEEARFAWSENGRKKPIPVLQAKLIEVIQQTKKRPVPNKPPSRVPQRKVLIVVGILTHKVCCLNETTDATADQMDTDSRIRWKNMDNEGQTSILEKVQGVGVEQLQ